jgi:hypothetical protein
MKHLLLILALVSGAAFTQASAYAQAGAPVSYEQPAYPDDTSTAYTPPDTVLEEAPANTVEGVFATFFALAAFIPIAVQFLRKLLIPDASGTGVQIFSWVTGLGITIAGWALHLGFLSDLSFWMALLYGAGACLAANGIFDTGLISAVFGLFGKKASLN